MHILISNDDGYLAPGLKAIADELAQFAQVTVVAPIPDPMRGFLVASGCDPEIY